MTAPRFVTKVPAAAVRASWGRDVTQFIEQLCPQVSDSVGGRAGEPLLLLPWQKTLLSRVFAVGAGGRLRHRTALVGMPRKNGKSALASGIGLWATFTGAPGSQVFSCAADRDQARIVFNAAKRMVELSPELSSGSKVFRDVIEIPATGSVYRVLSSEAYTKEGLSPTLTIFDELHAMPSDDLFNVMSLAMGARVNPLLLAITTAGVRVDSTGRDSVCFRLFEYGRQVASGEVDDPSFFMSWWSAKSGDDWRDPKVWRAANPGYGVISDPVDFESAVMRTPEAEFQTKRLNLWVNQQVAWLPTGAWQKLEKRPAPPEGSRVVLGFDGSFSMDSSVIVGCTVEEPHQLFTVGVWERQPTDRDDWRVDIAEVERAIVEACQVWDVREVACDPFRWGRSMQVLADGGVPVVEWPSTSARRMVPACTQFYDMVIERRLSHDGNPVLGRHLDNCVVKRDQLGPRIVKESRASQRRIDAAVAAVIALDRALWVPPEPVPPPVPKFFVT